MPDTRSYIRARTALFKKQQAIAEQIQTHDAWTAVFDHHLGMLRLCAFDQTGLRLATPFLLLRLNRDDDAYCFCRHWLKSNPLIPGIENTRERDWIYPREENSRFRDITQEGGEQGLSCLCDISSLVALAVIKMRLVAMYDALMQNVEAFAATNSSQLLGPDEQEEVPTTNRNWRTSTVSWICCTSGTPASFQRCCTPNHFYGCRTRPLTPRGHARKPEWCWTLRWTCGVTSRDRTVSSKPALGLPLPRIRPRDWETPILATPSAT